MKEIIKIIIKTTLNDQSKRKGISEGQAKEKIFISLF